MLSEFKADLHAEFGSGILTDKYFLRTKEILEKDNHFPHVVMQVFCKKYGVLCGIDYLKMLFKEYKDDFTVWSLDDGNCFTPWETVMVIQGQLNKFVHLETIYLGILARCSGIASITKECVNESPEKPIFYYGSRFDSFYNQATDGYAAIVGGATDVSTDANGCLLNKEGSGTMPHALIAAYNGDVVKALEAFDRHIDSDVKRIALVDFNNDCVTDSLACAKALGDKLYGVRLDTSEMIVDKSLQLLNFKETYRGVCPELVFNVRKALDNQGYKHVKIIVSGGFNPIKIKKFTIMNVPVDGYGIGSSLLKNHIDFTADIVQVDGKSISKVGRYYKPNSRLRAW